MGKMRCWPAGRYGPPNVPSLPRVSAMRQGVSGKNAHVVLLAGTKYPLISRMALVVSVANTLTAPLVPAGTTAALALVRPSSEFSVEIFGCGCPVGQTVR